jgi:hypothetical protein
MAPLEYEKHSFMGAYYGTALCDTCRNPMTGATVLKEIHKGYEHNGGKELTPEEANQIRNAQRHHPADHHTRIIFGHQDKRGPDGTTVTLYTAGEIMDREEKVEVAHCGKW